jgi:hypothetical protein
MLLLVALMAFLQKIKSTMADSNIMPKNIVAAVSNQWPSLKANNQAHIQKGTNRNGNRFLTSG